MLFRGWPTQAAAMEWRDVDENADWVSRYGDQVPVLCLGDEVICALLPDLDRIGQYFGGLANPL